MTTPGEDPEKFPGFDVLALARTWDDETRAAVFQRLGPPRLPTFFTAAEEPTARALFDRLLAQDSEPKVPVFEMVDDRLSAGEGDGYRYEEMPEDRDAWRHSLAALDEEAHIRHGGRFHELARPRQMAILDDVQQTEGRWRGLPAGRLFDLWMRYAYSAFYAHPFAWNEIGFPGPAYPRGYKNLGLDRREGFEVPEIAAEDPIPWVQRAEAVRRRHEASIERDGGGRNGEPNPSERP